LSKLENFANSKGHTTAQIAIAWLLAKGGGRLVVLIGTTQISHLNQNLGALSVKLSEEEVKELENMMSDVAGLRYDDFSLTLVDI